MYPISDAEHEVVGVLEAAEAVTGEDEQSFRYECLQIEYSV